MDIPFLFTSASLAPTEVLSTQATTAPGAANGSAFAATSTTQFATVMLDMQSLQRQEIATPTRFVDGLQTQALGGGLNIITAHQSPLELESLKAFAKSQGLDEHALQVLFPGATTSDATHPAASATLASDATAPQGLPDPAGAPAARTWAATSIDTPEVADLVRTAVQGGIPALLVDDGQMRIQTRSSSAVTDAGSPSKAGVAADTAADSALQPETLPQQPLPDPARRALILKMGRQQHRDTEPGQSVTQSTPSLPWPPAPQPDIAHIVRSARSADAPSVHRLPDTSFSLYQHAQGMTIQNVNPAELPGVEMTTRDTRTPIGNISSTVAPSLDAVATALRPSNFALGDKAPPVLLESRLMTRALSSGRPMTLPVIAGTVLNTLSESTLHPSANPGVNPVIAPAASGSLSAQRTAPTSSTIDSASVEKDIPAAQAGQPAAILAPETLADVTAAQTAAAQPVPVTNAPSQATDEFVLVLQGMVQWNGQPSPATQVSPASPRSPSTDAQELAVQSPKWLLQGLQIGSARKSPPGQVTASTVGPDWESLLQAITLRRQSGETEALRLELDPASLQMVDELDSANPAGSAMPQTVSPPVNGTLEGSSKNSPTPTAMPSAQPAAPQTGQELRVQAYQALADRMCHALGQRLQKQLEKGEWSIQLQLDPVKLGKIGIQLDMRSGELAAVFQTDNPVTRELLAQGSAKLKESLAQSGMSHASVWVGSDSSRQSGGNSTPHSSKTMRTQASPVVQSDSASEVQSVIRRAPQSGHGWDVLA